MAGYQDKFGPLGNIAVLAGRKEKKRLTVHTWVMSCRAFGRRIEHACFRALFERCGCTEIVREYRKTDRNGPMRDFLEGLTGETPEGKVALQSKTFQAHCPRLFHRIEDKGDE